MIQFKFHCFGMKREIHVVLISVRKVAEDFDDKHMLFHVLSKDLLDNFNKSAQEISDLV